MLGRRGVFIIIAALGVAGFAGGYTPGLGLSPRGEDRNTALAGDAERGAYVIRLAGCIACHTDGKNGGTELAGGREFKTPFGVFRSPNITPDVKTGIGGWTLEAFSNAVTRGLRPDGGHYYPAFPYTSYTKMSDTDVADLKAYLDTVKPVSNPVADHDLPFPFSMRGGLGLWKSMYFNDGKFQPSPDRSQSWNRGAYLANGPGHCAECHTPRTFLGGLDQAEAFHGAKQGPKGEKVPNITNDPSRGIGKWNEMDVAFLLQMGLTPEGDSVGGSMGDVIRDGTAHFSPEDISALTDYLLSPQQ